MADDDDVPDMLWLGSEFKRRASKASSADLRANEDVAQQVLLQPGLVRVNEFRDLAAAIIYHLTSHHDS